MDIVIRAYRPSDLDATIEIFLRSIREVASRDYAPAQIEAWAQVDDRNSWGARRSDRPTWLAMVGGQPAGFADLTAGGLIDMLFVHPDHQRKGVASELLKAAEAKAVQQGFERIHTHASKTARPFFEHHGFRVVTPQSVQSRGQWFENFVMEKRLR